MRNERIGSPDTTVEPLIPEAVAAAEHIVMCTGCGRLVSEVDEDDECSLCVERECSRALERLDDMLNLIAAVLQEADLYVHRDDVIDVVHANVSADGPRLAEARAMMRQENERTIAQVEQHNAEVKRLRAAGAQS